MIRDLIRFLKRWKGLLGLVTVVGPWLAKLTPFSPPWPASESVNQLTILVQMVILAGVIGLWWQGAWRRTWLPVSIAAGFAALFTLFWYLSAAGTYVVTLDGEEEKAYVIGYELLPKIAELRAHKPEFYTDKELLRQFERDPDQIWTKVSLAYARNLLVRLWAAFWGSLLLFAGLLVASVVRSPNDPSQPPQSKLILPTP
jgi:hypothetical protein